MKTYFAIKVFKEYFNFASAHFLFFKDGTHEPLHGHNYRVEATGYTETLSDDLVFDFLNLKPLVRDACNELDHKLLLPRDNPYCKIEENAEGNLLVTSLHKTFFSFPKDNVKILPIENTSVERLAEYLSGRIKKKLLKNFKFEFSKLEIEVEETRGQSALYSRSK